mmetsp:Transcript_27335/g.59786  ORF Transcript_27335/g.59786 Transcript_27335/m.59786 type:complete len:270 (-) Transcript_27335:365-1174(-)
MGFALGNTCAKLWNIGQAITSKKPGCDLDTPGLSRSNRGETAMPLRFSRSPWLKNSDSSAYTHLMCTSSPSAMSPMSAILSATCSVRSLSFSSMGVCTSGMITPFSRDPDPLCADMGPLPALRVTLSRASTAWPECRPCILRSVSGMELRGCASRTVPPLEESTLLSDCARPPFAWLGGWGWGAATSMGVAVVANRCTVLNWLWMLKCCFMSVASTSSIIVFLSFSLSPRGKWLMKFSSGRRNNAKAAARWWFSIGDLSLYSCASGFSE